MIISTCAIITSMCYSFQSASAMLVVALIVVSKHYGIVTVVAHIHCPINDRTTNVKNIYFFEFFLHNTGFDDEIKILDSASKVKFYLEEMIKN